MNDHLGWGGDGPKPTGMIFIDGMLYLAVQNVRRNKQAPFSVRSQHGSDAHIIFSNNYGGIWGPAFQNIKDDPMFPGHHFGGPVFINFGKNNANARDEYVYAVSPDQWDNGSNLRIGRVLADSILRKEAWEFLCAWNPDGQPAWHHNLEEAIPILSLHRQLSQPDMVYVAGINRYLLLTWTLHKDFSGDDGTDLLILESPEPWGPFSIVHYEELWETKELTPYCPKLPLKWMAADGRSGWLQFSGSWSPRGQKENYYRSHVRPFSLTLA
jgi:hypothetical protein